MVSPPWKLFVEGGGYHNDALKTECRRAFTALPRTTKTKGRYDKGGHAFKLLAKLDPNLVRRSGRWADRFFATLDRLMK